MLSVSLKQITMFKLNSAVCKAQATKTNGFLRVSTTFVTILNRP